MLESKFAEDFSSPFYPLLADMYLNEGDLPRARKVCEVGLEHDSNNVDGKFVFARVAMAEKRYTVAEKWLKKVVDGNPAHFKALRMLIKLEFQLNRSTKTIHNYINRLLRFLPDDAECEGWLSKIQVLNPDPLINNDLPPNPPVVERDTNNVSTIKPAPVVKKTYEVEQSMATFTMVKVLKSQQHYNQALVVLEMLEPIGIDGDKIAKERDIILKHISESQK